MTHKKEISSKTKSKGCLSTQGCIVFSDVMSSRAAFIEAGRGMHQSTAFTLKPIMTVAQLRHVETACVLASKSSVPGKRSVLGLDLSGFPTYQVLLADFTTSTFNSLNILDTF